MKFELSFTNKEMTPWGGMVFLKQMLDKIGFKDQIKTCQVLPEQKSNRAYGIDVLLESFITSIWCGANRFLHTEVTRSDKALGKIFDWHSTPGQDAYKRYFGKFTQSTNQSVGHHFFSGFFQNDIMDYLEEKNMNYIIAAKFTYPVQHLIDRQDFWLEVAESIEICDKTYQSSSWQKARRIVIVRQKIAERPDAPGKMLSLFPEDEIHRNYRYSAYMTNLEYSAVDVWRNYRARGDAENRIKELKQDFGAESFNLKEFFPTEAALIFAMIAYNLMSIFRIFVLQEKTQKNNESGLLGCGTTLWILR